MTIANGNAKAGDGGSILVNSSSTLVLINSILEGNRGNLGYGLNILGIVTVINSTLSNNQAKVFGGGGIGNLGTITLNNDTITNNMVVVNSNSTFGGGVENFFGGIFTAQNTIIAGNLNNNNQAADVSTDFDGITGDPNNLIGALNGALGTIGTGSDTSPSPKLVSPTLTKSLTRFCKIMVEPHQLTP